ncbi:MAG: radical SAM protein [Pseudomonadota bacterium]
MAQLFPFAFFVVGDGEEPLLRIVRHVENGNDASRLVSLTRSDPNIHHPLHGKEKNVVPSKTDINSLQQPRRSNIGILTAMSAQIQIEGSRGCSWNKCSFCSIPGTMPDGWAPIDEESIIQQIVEISQSGAGYPHFTDSDFFGNDPMRATRLALRISEEKRLGRINPEMEFYFNLLTTSILGGFNVRKEDCAVALMAWKDAGLTEVFIGIESGSKKQIQRYQKASTRIKNLAAIQMARQLGLSLDIGFIMFDHASSLEELSENLNFIHSANLDYHPSRLTHPMRLQMGTDVVASFDGQLGDLDIDSLSFSYAFQDPTIAKIVAMLIDVNHHFSCWTEQQQAVFHSSDANNTEKFEAKYRLGKFRKIELSFLKSLAESPATVYCPHAETNLVEQLEQVTLP